MLTMLQRIIIFLLVTMVWLGGVPASAAAEGWGRLMTPKSPLNLRAGRGPSSKRITTFMPGRRIRVDFEKNGWVAVFEPDVKERDISKAIGYVKASYLVPVGDWGEYRTPRGMLNIRKGRGPRTAHVRTLQPGDLVKVDFEKNGWVAVFEAEEKVRSLDRAIGYSKSKFLFPADPEQIERVLSAGKPEAEKGASEVAVQSSSVSAEADQAGHEPSAPSEQAVTDPSSASPAHWGRLVKVSRRVNVRKKRTAASELVDTLEPGQAVRVDLLRKGWYAAFALGESQRDEAHALGFIYSPLLENDLDALPELDRERESVPAPQHNDMEAAPMNQVRGTVSSEPPAELRESGSTAETQQPPQAPESQSMVVEPPETSEPHKGPMPVADETRHGFHFKVMERMESRQGRYPLDVLKVFLDVTVVPGSESLSDFCRTLWKEQWRQGTLMRVDVYLPGMDLKDLSYGEALFDGKGIRQFWTREAVLYGTRFQR